MSSSHPFYAQLIQQNNYNIPSYHSTPNINPMTVSGTLQTPGKPLRNYMCSGRNNCSSRH